VRVLVYNIHAGKDAARVDNLERVAEIIRSSQAEIVMLQEVDKKTRRSGGVDQLSRLRDLTGMHGVFGKAIEYDGGEYGIAVMSRWPIVSSVFALLPGKIDQPIGRGGYEARGALIARINTPGQSIRVVNTHLDASRSDSNRLVQGNELIALANVQRKSGFTIVGGDLNSEPDSPLAHLFEQNGWRDMFVACGQENGFSFPADKPVKRIDYLFAGPRTACKSAKVLDTQASDHRPVLFEVVPSGRD
jgi:endonuclease/exonuclease/phosphatase family metal-dependent hydrolase